MSYIDALETLKVSIMSDSSEEVKQKFVLFEDKYWACICDVGDRNFAEDTMKTIMDVDTIDDAINAFGSLLRLFNPRNSEYTCVATGYLNGQLSRLIDYSVDQFHAMWKHWKPHTKLTIVLKAKLENVFCCNLYYLEECLFKSPLAARVSSDQLVKLLSAILPFVVIYHASKNNDVVGNFSSNVPFDIDYVKFFIHSLTNESMLNKSTVEVALLRLLGLFINSKAGLIPTIEDLADRFKFVFFAYGYYFTEKEIKGFYEHALLYLISLRFEANFDSDWLFQVLDGLTLRVLHSLDDIIDKFIARDRAFLENKLAAVGPDQVKSNLHNIIEAKMMVVVEENSVNN